MFDPTDEVHNHPQTLHAPEPLAHLRSAPSSRSGDYVVTAP
jgi:hypothetical protein